MTDFREGPGAADAAVIAAARRLLLVMLPGGDGYPSADRGGIAERLVERLADDAQDAAAFSRLLDELGRTMSPRAALTELFEGDPAAMRRVLQCAYAAYYEEPAVRAVLEARHGYPNRPPQPLGYRPATGGAQLARLEARRVRTLETSDWWPARFDGLDDVEETA